MKRSEILSTVLLVVVLALSFLTMVCSGRNSAFSPTILTPPPLFIGAIFHGNLASLNQSTRIEIYNFIVGNPGIQFRGICNYLNLPIGVTQYHLNLLTKAGLVSVFCDGRYKRYFQSKRFTETEMTIISILRHETARKILLILLQKQTIPHKKLSLQLKISSQALTWQIKRLRETGLIKSVREGIRVKYFVNKASVMTVKRCADFIARK